MATNALSRRFSTPRNATVVGAGIVGLSAALHLRHAGLDVTIVEADHAGAGASWGNAGWLTPEIATPLPEPAVLSTGLKTIMSANSPLYIPPRADANLIRFLLGFARHCTPAKWRAGMAALMPLNARSLDAFDELADLGVDEPTHPTDTFLAAFAKAGQEQGLLEEFTQIRALGYHVEAEQLTGDEVRAIAPAVSADIETGIRLSGTRFINPPRYVDSLKRACAAAGVRLRHGTVTGVDGGSPVAPAIVTIRGPNTGEGRPGSDHLDVDQPDVDQPDVDQPDIDQISADLVVVATGASLPQLLKPLGVRTVIQAGRGYSFTVPVDPMPEIPLYFHHERVACTPLGDRYRIAGMMEFRRAQAPLDPRRIAAVVNATKPLLAGADFTDRVDEWVGSRPCTPDGLPLIGPTRSPRVVAAGGHGMWGMTQGPLTGKLIADYARTGVVPEILAPVNPLR